MLVVVFFFSTKFPTALLFSGKSKPEIRMEMLTVSAGLLLYTWFTLQTNICADTIEVGLLRRRAPFALRCEAQLWCNSRQRYRFLITRSSPYLLFTECMLSCPPLKIDYAGQGKYCGEEEKEEEEVGRVCVFCAAERNCEKAEVDRNSQLDISATLFKRKCLFISFSLSLFSLLYINVWFTGTIGRWIWSVKRAPLPPQRTDAFVIYQACLFNCILSDRLEKSSRSIHQSCWNEKKRRQTADVLDVFHISRYKITGKNTDDVIERCRFSHLFLSLLIPPVSLGRGRECWSTAISMQNGKIRNMKLLFLFFKML